MSLDIKLEVEPPGKIFHCLILRNLTMLAMFHSTTQSYILFLFVCLFFSALFVQQTCERFGPISIFSMRRRRKSMILDQG